MPARLPQPRLSWIAIGLALAAAACHRQPPSGDPPSASISGVTAARAPRPKPANPAVAAPAPIPNASNDAPAPTAFGAPRGFVRMIVGGITPTSHGNAVLLVDGDKKVAIPIFVGDTEALSIQLRLEKRHYERPLTHDLLDSMMTQLGGRVESVRVDKVENDVYFGTIVVATAERRIELDSRSSDAVALALGNDAPIFVAEDVVKKAAVALDQFHGDAKAEEPEVRVEAQEREAFSL